MAASCATILEDLVDATTKDLKLLDELETEGLEMRINARAVVVLPWLVLVALTARPGAFRDFYRSAGGVLTIVVAALLTAVGVVVLGRLGREPVEERVFRAAGSSRELARRSSRPGGVGVAAAAIATLLVPPTRGLGSAVRPYTLLPRGCARSLARRRRRSSVDARSGGVRPALRAAVAGAARTRRGSSASRINDDQLTPAVAPGR